MAKRRRSKPDLADRLCECHQAPAARLARAIGAPSVRQRTATNNRFVHWIFMAEGNPELLREEEEEVREKRDLARRARRMAEGLTLPGDRARLTQYAEELEKQASELEQAADKQAAQTASPPLVTQEQQQVQQQQTTETEPKEPEQ
jgi:SH3-like domain-containing protein